VRPEQYVKINIPETELTDNKTAVLDSIYFVNSTLFITARHLSSSNARLIQYKPFDKKHILTSAIYAYASTVASFL
jgi:hypothetical protein